MTPRVLLRTCALGAALLAGAACAPTPHRFPLDFERMRNQPRYDLYDRSPVFDNGTGMRLLPAHTVPVEPWTGEVDAAPAPVRADAIPVHVTPALMATGRHRFDVFCSPCHGVTGDGQTPVARNMQLRRPPSLLDPRIRALSVGSIFTVITEGYGLMPSYAYQIRPQDRWGVVAYVRALQRRAGVALDELPPAVRADAEAHLRQGGGDD